LTVAALVVLSCGGPPVRDTQTRGSAPAPSSAAPLAPASTAEPTALALGTGRLPPSEGKSLELEAVARHVQGDVEYLKAALPPLPVSDQLTISEVGGLWLGLDSAAQALSFVTADARGTSSVWIRRKGTTDPAQGYLYTPALPSRFAGSGASGHRFPITVRTGAATRDDPTLEAATFAALAIELDTEPTAFGAFAATRLRDRAAAARTREPLRSALAVGHGGGGAEFSELMDTMTGRLSVQLALQRSRELHLGTARERRSIPLARVAPPRVDRHDWAKLRAALGRATPDEPLAQAVPASFYFVRAREIGKLLDVVDMIDDWGQSAATLLDGSAEERGTFGRYQTELGLERTGLTRVLGPELILDLALVGSDPYVNEGTDVTLVMRPKHATGLGLALAVVLEKAAKGRGPLTVSSFQHEGVTVTARRSADGRVRQHRATVNGLELISNSPGAIRRVISANVGKEPRLIDELDFLYMLARDADTPDDVLCYLGERFIDSVVGPRQKIAQARRQIALSELMVPGFSALLHGLVEGRTPASKTDLLRAKWLDPKELAHADGSPIEWEPGRAARSRFGTAEAQRARPLSRHAARRHRVR
jgi:hypothetical protein